jgi:hypothetical protein
LIGATIAGLVSVTVAAADVQIDMHVAIIAMKSAPIGNIKNIRHTYGIIYFYQILLAPIPIWYGFEFCNSIIR